MGNNNEQISLTDIVVAEHPIADLVELIMQLMQHIIEKRVKIKGDRIWLQQVLLLTLLLM